MALAVVAGAVLLGTAPTAAAAQADASAGLEFLDIPAGASVDEVRARVRAGDGTLRCETSRADARVQDCRGGFVSDDGAGIEVWFSAINGTAGVLTLSTQLDNDLLEQWRSDLAVRYGTVNARAQGTQWMQEWIRRGQMLRLTWRVDGGQKRISVSLVDGPTLDGWRPAAAARPSRRAAPRSSPQTDSTQNPEPPLSRP
jgi:hypothetical protein